MSSRNLLLQSALMTLVACSSSIAQATEGWGSPHNAKSAETIACNRSDADAHGLVCLKLDCVGSRQYRFTIIADAEFFGNTTFSAPPNSVTLSMEQHRSDDPDLEGWNVSEAPVGADFLERISNDKQIEILNDCDGCKIVAIALANFSTELRRVGAACKFAK